MTIPINKNAKALIFDLDGTLADTMPAHKQAWVRAGEYFNVPLTSEMVQSWAGMASYKIVGMINEQFGLSLEALEVSQKKAAYFHEIQGESVAPIEPIYSIAEKYKDILLMGIGTGSRKANAEKILNGLGIRNWFQSVITADDVEHHKPAPDTYLKCADELRIAPEYCQVFEDADFGVRSAIAAGMHVVDIREHI